MARPSGITLQIKDFKRLEKALTPARVQAAFQKHVGKATLRAGLRMVKAARQEIKKGVKPTNAALTQALKGSSKTLFDKGDLVNAITFLQTAWNTGFVGINQKEELFDLAKNLHDGITFSVSDKMRNMFLILARATVARNTGTSMPKLTGRTAELWALHQDWKPLKDSTTKIRIRKRPFMARALNNKANRRRVIEEWKKGIAAAMKELAR